MPEIVFRIVALLLFVLYRVVRRAWESRLRTHLEEQPTIERKPARERWLLGIMGVLAIPLLIWFLSPWVDFAHVELPEWARWVGAVVCAVGVWCFWRTHVALAHNWAPLLEVREGNTLVDSGPYRLIRHPMYSAGFVVNIGLSLLSSNWLVSAGLLVGMVLVYAVRVPDEEQMMLDAFGDQYREYMARTGRLIPKMSVLIRRR